MKALRTHKFDAGRVASRYTDFVNDSASGCDLSAAMAVQKGHALQKVRAFQYFLMPARVAEWQTRRT
jgi:hypothetical protein